MTARKFYDSEGMRRVLCRAAERAGSFRLLAAKADVSEAFVSLVRHGKREPGPKLLNALGLDVAYVFVARKPVQSRRVPKKSRRVSEGR